ncbi:hypothetical protein SDC9_117752 [bioreactor metagenome]|uniref:Uncharacterized protein n=1 Tax=bioreactor metagenome TaxID=1076179 RepID=A0A645BZL7_9ZZZZ
MGYRVRNAVFELIAPYNRYSACKIDSFLCAVTDYNRFIKKDGIFLHINSYIRLGCRNLHILGNKSHK